MQNNEGWRTLTAGASTLPKYRLVTIASGPVVNLCGVDSTYFMGVTREISTDTGELVEVDLSPAGTKILTAAGSITAGVEVTFSALGKVKTASADDVIVGVAITSCTTDGDYVEVALAKAASADSEIIGQNPFTVDLGTAVELVPVQGAVDIASNEINTELPLGTLSNDTNTATLPADAVEGQIYRVTATGAGVGKAVVTDGTYSFDISVYQGNFVLHDGVWYQLGTLMESQGLQTSVLAAGTAIDALELIVGDGLDTMTITSTGIAATDAVTITIQGVAPVTLTAVANGATPGANEFCIGTGGTIDDTTAENLAHLIATLSATTLPGCTATHLAHVVTVKCEKPISAAASAGDEAKVVVANHTTASLVGDHTARILQAQVDIDAIEASDIVHKARTTALETADELQLLAATGNIAAKTLVNVILDTVAKWGYASTSVLNSLYYSAAGAAAGAQCIAIPWQSRPYHVCTATAAVIDIGDLVVVTSSGQVVKISAGAGKVVIGQCVVGCGAGGGNVTIAPCAPWITLA